MVALNFDRGRPDRLLNLNEVDELRGWERDNGSLRLGSGLTYAEIEHGELRDVVPALAEASRTVGSPQIRNRGTIGGNLGDGLAGRRRAAAADDRGRGGRVCVRARRPHGSARRVRHRRQANALAADELITAVRLTPSRAPQTFMKVGPRNAMVIAVVSLAVSAGDELRASFGSASPRPVLVTAPRDDAGSFAEQVAAAASPIDDVRGTERYRRHALRVLAERALQRVLA